MITEESCHEIAAIAVANAFRLAHEKAGAVSGDESMSQLIRKHQIVALLADLLHEQTNANLNL